MAFLPDVFKEAEDETLFPLQSDCLRDSEPVSCKCLIGSRIA